MILSTEPYLTLSSETQCKPAGESSAAKVTAEDKAKEPRSYTGLPAHLKGLIRETDGPPPYTGVPAHLKGLVRETDGPPPYTGNPFPGILRETDGPVFHKYEEK